MAGWVIVGPERERKAAGRLFRWVVSTVAANVDDPALKQRPDEIVTANLPILDLAELSDAQRAAVRAVIRDRLVEEARGEFAVDMAVDPDLAITYVRELPDLVPAA